MTLLLLLALALAMDAFAVAIAHGANVRTGAGAAVRIGAAFGLAQGVMPLGGWLAGLAFAGLIQTVDHWIAFALLAVLGIKMIREGLSDAEDAARTVPLAGRALFVAAVATSIDAAAAGLTLGEFAVPVGIACGMIGAVTALLCWAGTLAGAAVGARFGKHAEIAGGIVLIAIGAKILVEHLSA
jgi:manganese efflux pump family protein